MPGRSPSLIPWALLRPREIAVRLLFVSPEESRKDKAKNEEELMKRRKGKKGAMYVN